MKSSSQKDIQSVFNTAEELLLSVELGYEDLVKGPFPRQLHGFKTLVVFGRAITNVLQNLRSCDTQTPFDSWYKPYKDEMENDPLMKHFYNLRSLILKQSYNQIGIFINVDGLPPASGFLETGQPPPKAKGFFISNTGVGWVFQKPDGSEERVYVDLPLENVSTGLVLPNPPTTHLGETVTDTSTANLCRLYARYLKRLVDSARAQFMAASQKKRADGIATIGSD